MEDLGRVISEHPFCKGLEVCHVDLLTNCASNVRFQKRCHLFREGGEANQFYLIREGKTSLEIRAPQGSPLIVETAKRSEVLGWCWPAASYRWHFGARLAPFPAIYSNSEARNRKKPQQSIPGKEIQI